MPAADLGVLRSLVNTLTTIIIRMAGHLHVYYVGRRLEVSWFCGVMGKRLKDLGGESVDILL